MIKVAAIGVGSMGKNHARVYNELPEADLVAVSDASQPIVEGIADRFGAKAYVDYREMLEKERPEAVSIAVPTALHEEVAMAAMEAGAHILVEKPIAATLEEGQRLIDRARELERKLMVGHIVRFNPAIQALKQKLAMETWDVFSRSSAAGSVLFRLVSVMSGLWLTWLLMTSMLCGF
jgi:predicted dehydrogenase